MKRCFKSNIPDEEKRSVTIAIVINGGVCWGIHNSLTGKQIKRIENLLTKIYHELDAAKKVLEK